MLRGVGAAAAVLIAAACTSGEGEERSKEVRTGATASTTGDLVWVVGGTEGPIEALSFGDTSSWEPGPDVTVYGVDGAPVATIDLDLERDESVVQGAVVAVGDRTLLVGGRCASAGFGCAGPVTPVAAWLDAERETAEMIAVGDPATGEARLLGIAGDAAWVLVDRYGAYRVVRLAADGGVHEVELPPDAWTGWTCAGPDGLVSAVAALDDAFVARSLQLWTSPATDEPAWAEAGVVPLADYTAGVVAMHCLAGGEVVLDIGDPGNGPFVIDVVSGSVLSEAPDGVRGGGPVGIAVDPAGRLAAAVAMTGGPESPVFVHRPGGEWVEHGVLRWSGWAQPMLAVSGDRVLDLGGMAFVDGARPRELRPSA